MMPQTIFQSLAQIRPIYMRPGVKLGNPLGGKIKPSSRVLYGTDLVSSEGVVAKYGQKQADNRR